MAKKDPQSIKAKSPSPAPSSSSASSSSSSSSSASEDERRSPGPEQAFVPAASVHAARSSKYSAPMGFKPLRVDSTPSLDYDTLANRPDLQLWAVRLPEGVKASALDGLTLQLPPTSSSSSTLEPTWVLDGPIGRFTKSSSEYQIHLAPSSSGVTNDDDDETKTTLVRIGTEMDHLVPLLPRASKRGNLFQAPTPISRSLYITRSLPLSTHFSSSSSSSSSLIASQPSPVPGALLTSEQLLLPSTSEEILKIRPLRSQPKGIELKYRSILSGTRGGGVGGIGKYRNPGVSLQRSLALATNDEGEQQQGQGLSVHVQEGGMRIEKEEGVEVKQAEMVDVVVVDPEVGNRKQKRKSRVVEEEEKEGSMGQKGDKKKKRKSEVKDE